MTILEYDPREEEKMALPCKCGMPDMPGFCPGPLNCPMAEEEEETDDGG